MARLKDLYKSKVVGEMVKEFRYKNRMAVPRLEKIIVSMGVGKAVQDKKFIELAKADLTMITGQMPLMCKAKKSVSNFKVRAGQETGLKVTIRGERMYEFMDRLVNVTLPRIRDFNGVSFKSFDKQGNYSIGLEEQAIFPEIDPGKIAHVQGLDVTFVFNKGPQEQTLELLSLLGMPFRKKSARSE